MLIQYKVVTSDLEPEKHNIWIKDENHKIYKYIQGEWVALNVTEKEFEEFKLWTEKKFLELELDLTNEIRARQLGDEWLENDYTLKIAQLSNDLRAEIKLCNDRITGLEKVINEQVARLDGRINSAEQDIAVRAEAFNTRINQLNTLYTQLDQRITNEIRIVNNTINTKEKAIYNVINIKETQIYQKITSVQTYLEGELAKKRDLENGYFGETLIETENEEGTKGIRISDSGTYHWAENSESSESETTIATYSKPGIIWAKGEISCGGGEPGTPEHKLSEKRDKEDWEFEHISDDAEEKSISIIKWLEEPDEDPDIRVRQPKKSLYVYSDRIESWSSNSRSTSKNWTIGAGSPLNPTIAPGKNNFDLIDVVNALYSKITELESEVENLKSQLNNN